MKIICRKSQIKNERKEKEEEKIVSERKQINLLVVETHL